MEKITVEHIKRILPTWEKEGQLSRQKIQKLLSVSENDARFIRGLLANRNLIQDVSQLAHTVINTEQPVKTFERTKDGNLVVEHPVSGTLAELLEKFDIDKEYWQITKSVVNEWGAEGNYNRQAKAWLSRIGDIWDWETFKKDFIAEMKKLVPPSPKIDYKPVKRKKLLEISIYDLHLGKLAWALESGSNYDSKIAEERFFTAIHALVDAARSQEVERILFPVGNDFFNSDKDYPYPQTTAGTPQESDLRWQKVYKNGRVMVVKAIELLKTVAPVDVIVVQGNHDFQKIFYLGDALEMRYENDPNVTVNNSPSTRKYYQYGQVLLGFAHGRRTDAPPNRLLMLMPQEQPQLWAKTKFREWHLGDIHHAKSYMTKAEEDMQGIMIKYMRTLKGQDSWESQKGYFSLGGAEAICWDADHGKTATYYFNL